MERVNALKEISEHLKVKPTVSGVWVVLSGRTVSSIMLQRLAVKDGRSVQGIRARFGKHPSNPEKWKTFCQKIKRQHGGVCIHMENSQGGRKKSSGRRPAHFSVIVYRPDRDELPRGWLREARSILHQICFSAGL